MSRARRVVLVAVLGLAVHDGLAALRPARPAPPAEAPPVAGRPTIAFILGSDGFHRNAAFHFRTHAVERTDLVVETCRTIEEVLRHLEAHRPSAGPWGEVVLVAHGNPWTGLAVPVRAGGRTGTAGRTTAEALDGALRAGALPRLRPGVVDGRTRIRVLACAVGRDAGLLAALGRTFAAGGGTPRVVSSEGFQAFLVEEAAGTPVASRRVEMDVRFVFHPEGYPPGEIRLARLFDRAHPGEGIDWRDALSKTAPDAEGRPFHLSFRVPVEWVVRYPAGGRPAVSTKDEEARWLAERDELGAYLAARGLRPDDFTWRIDHRTVDGADGRPVPAVRALGVATAVCVLALPAEARVVA